MEDHPSSESDVKREVCFLIGREGQVLWSDASTSPTALPDSRARWEAIWRHRDELEEIAHSHPIGPAVFSAEDESTMEALVSALGRSPRFSVVSPQGLRVRDEDGQERMVQEEPGWVAQLRDAVFQAMADESLCGPRDVLLLRNAEVLEIDRYECVRDLAKCAAGLDRPLALAA